MQVHKHEKQNMLFFLEFFTRTSYGVMCLQAGVNLVSYQFGLKRKYVCSFNPFVPAVLK